MNSLTAMPPVIGIDVGSESRSSARKGHGRHVTVSVVLPNFNHASELESSIPALLEQTDQPEEIIVVDDGSTDGSVELLQSYARRAPHLKIRRHQANRGVEAAISTGLEAAAGNYIILASADELVHPELCASLRQAIEQFPNARMAFARFGEWNAQNGQARSLNPRDPREMWYVRGDQPEFVSSQDFIEHLSRRFVCLSANAAIIERRALLEVGGFDPALKWHSDWFAMYALAFRYGFVAVPKSLALFRLSNDSYSARGMKVLKKQSEVALNIQRKIHAAEFQDVRKCLQRAPAAMSTFMRATLLTLPWHPRYYPMLARILIWWSGEVVAGRRPKFWSAFLGREQA